MHIIFNMLDADSELRDYFTNVIKNKRTGNKKIGKKRGPYKKNTYYGASTQLCWECQRLLKYPNNLCSWITDLKPVENWRAEKVKYKSLHPDKDVYKDTYHIISCPLFVGENNG